MRALRQASCLQRGSPAIRPPGRASSRPHIVPLRCWHPSVSVVAVLAGHLGENLILHFRDNESISFFSAFASLFVHPAPSTGSMCHYGPLPWAGRLIIKKKIEKKRCRGRLALCGLCCVTWRRAFRRFLDSTLQALIYVFEGEEFGQQGKAAVHASWISFRARNTTSPPSGAHSSFCKLEQSQSVLLSSHRSYPHRRRVVAKLLL